ncbi:MAG TPA: CxxC-x17-CxxC domain-containing protein [Candidatus Nanoarchaeia archaeon]|nr:CxxC-x17-CxxC domain-containing protein [Candidatus Nanoarchaeia archaeon]
MAQKPQYDVKCTSCGQPTTVPFKPTPNRPVYCKTCFAKQRSSSGPAPSNSSGPNSPSEGPINFDSKQAWARRR